MAGNEVFESTIRGSTALLIYSSPLPFPFLLHPV